MPDTHCPVCGGPCVPDQGVWKCQDCDGFTNRPLTESQKIERIVDTIASHPAELIRRGFEKRHRWDRKVPAQMEMEMHATSIHTYFKCYQYIGCPQRRICRHSEMRTSRVSVFEPAIFAISKGETLIFYCPEQRRGGFPKGACPPDIERRIQDAG